MPNNNSIELILEAALFFKGGTVSIKELVTTSGFSAEEVEAALLSLAASLQGRGIRLVRERDTASLATAPEAETYIEKMRREELEGPLGKAGLETLAIIIFRGPIPRADVEYVRGVNCSSILRSLLIRGLIERVDNPDDKRSFLYRATSELPAYLGVETLEQIPGYAATRMNIENIFAERENASREETPSEADVA